MASDGSYAGLRCHSPFFCALRVGAVVEHTGLAQAFAASLGSSVRLLRFASWTGTPVWCRRLVSLYDNFVSNLVSCPCLEPWADTPIRRPRFVSGFGISAFSSQDWRLHVMTGFGVLGLASRVWHRGLAFRRSSARRDARSGPYPPAGPPVCRLSSQCLLRPPERKC